MSGDNDGNDFLSSFKKDIEDDKSKGKSVIEDLQVTIKEKEHVIEQKDAKIADMEKKIKELTVMAKGAFLAPKVPGASARAGEEIEQLEGKIKSLKDENDKLQEELGQLKKVDAQNKKLEKKIEDQKKEILELKQKKDFDLSQFSEDGDDPTVNSQVRVLKTRVKNLEKKVEEEKPDELRERIKELEADLQELRKAEKEQSSRVKELEAKCEILERSPLPTPPPAAPASRASPSGLPEPPSMPRGPPAPPGMPGFPGDKKPSFSTPPPLPPSPSAPPAPPSSPPAPPVAPSGVQANPMGGPAGSSTDVHRLQKELRDMQDRYAAMSREVDEFKVTMSDTTILNLKTRRIFDLQDQVKSLMKQMQDNPEVKKLKQELDDKQKAVESMDNEKNTLIYHYNDLKAKYEEIYALIQERDDYISTLTTKYEEIYKMIQERDDFINMLRGQMQMMAEQMQQSQQQPPP